MRTSWCDKLASTPAIGVALDKVHHPSASIVSALQPLLSRFSQGDDDEFALNKQDTFSLELTTNDGFSYAINPSQIVVEFRHRLKIKHTSGGPPTAEMLSRPQPFTQLLPEATTRLLEVVKLVDPAGARTIKRAGIVSATKVNVDDAPPGVLRLIKHLGRPWQELLPFYEFQVTGKILDEPNKWMDRCIHHITRTEADGELLTLRFDYQRLFTEERKTNRLSDTLKPFTDSTLQYFEEIAEGNRFHAT